MISSSENEKTKTRQALIKEIVFDDNKVYITDHVWVDFNDNFYKVDIGDLIHFKAKVYNYPTTDDEGRMVLKYGLNEVSEIRKLCQDDKCSKCEYRIQKSNHSICRKTDNIISQNQDMVSWCPHLSGGINECRGCKFLTKKRHQLFCSKAKDFIGKEDAFIKKPEWCPGRRVKMTEHLIENESCVNVKLDNGENFENVRLVDEDTYNYLFKSDGNFMYIHKSNVVMIEFQEEEVGINA